MGQALIALTGGFKLAGMMEQNEALDDEAQAAADQADLEIQELDRQRRQASAIAQERKADRVITADRQFASMIAAMADNGGHGTQNEARFGAEIGFYEGLDLARIEGNRKREIEALHSKQVAARQVALNTATRVAHQKRINFFTFAASTASSFGMDGSVGGKSTTGGGGGGGGNGFTSSTFGNAGFAQGIGSGGFG